MLKYIQVQFWNSAKPYTYITKRKLKMGDFVVVPTQKDNTVGRVLFINVEKPIFECKHIIKKVRL